MASPARPAPCPTLRPTPYYYYITVLRVWGGLHACVTDVPSYRLLEGRKSTISYVLLIKGDVSVFRLHSSASAHSTVLPRF
jgi:hypothetical protein